MISVSHLFLCRPYDQSNHPPMAPFCVKTLPGVGF
jgi:hypothetical protein